MKAVVINGSSDYKEMVLSLGYTKVDMLMTNSYFEPTPDIGLVVFTGGHDVTPMFYGHPFHDTTRSSFQRDAYEFYVANICKSHGIPMVGICRGAQFLHVFNGYTLNQDITGHIGNHRLYDIKTNGWLDGVVTSTHHQCMSTMRQRYSRASYCDILAVGTQDSLVERYEQGKFVKGPSNGILEVVWHESTKSLCFQPHPEYHRDTFNIFLKYFNDTIGTLKGQDTP